MYYHQQCGQYVQLKGKEISKATETYFFSHLIYKKIHCVIIHPDN